MSRRYRLGRRRAAADATRRRIVEATLRVHDEQGISGTSVRDIASRAGVAPATVLNHFPAMSELIRACGELSDERYPMPTTAVLVGARDRAEAVRLMARAMFAWWEAMGPGWEHLQVDRRTLPEVDAWLRDVDRRHRALIGAVIGPGDRGRLTAILTALTSHGAWRSLRDAGFDPDRAAAEVARVFIGSAERGAVTHQKDLH